MNELIKLACFCCFSNRVNVIEHNRTLSVVCIFIKSNILYQNIFELSIYMHSRWIKNYEDLTLHYPLVPADFLISKDNLELLSNPNIHSSCRCEPIRINRIAETVLKSMEHAEKLARSAQQKRGPPIRQLHLCANKRQKKE